jgi:hypothetical protein
MSHAPTRNGRPRPRVLWLAPLVFGFTLAACGDDSPEAGGGSAAVAPAEPVLSDALVAATWPVQMANDAARAPFEGHPGWSAMFGRDLNAALAAFGAEGAQGRGLARTHAELAAMYRQGALLAANATRHVYGTDRQADIDPPQVDYVVGVSQALLGACTDAGAALGAASGDGVPAAGLAYWTGKAARAPCGSLQLDAPDGAFPRPAGAPKPGALPTAAPTPHLQFAEQGDEARTVDVTDPAALMALAVWHEDAARAAAPEGEAAFVDAVLAPWRLAGEARPALELTDAGPEWLFSGFALAPADLPFLVVAPVDGVAAVTAHAATSPLAAALLPAVAGDAIDPDKVLDLAATVGQQLEQGMATAGGGVQAFHRPFAEIARVAVLRAGMLVADGAGQYRDAGILRINALERSNGPAGDPVFLLSVAAWDAGNRNPLRAQELIHALAKAHPALEAARTPLDALHIRLSRNTASGGPVF